jgi:hypothetical protein
VAGKKKLLGGNLKAINNTSSTTNIICWDKARTALVKHVVSPTLSVPVNEYYRTHFKRPGVNTPLPEDIINDGGNE